MHEYTTKELCEERHKRVEDKLNFIGGTAKAVLVTLIIEVVVLGFLAIRSLIV